MDKPAKLFKYRAIDEYTARIFTHRELYFARPEQFNDPFESRFDLSYEGTPEQRVRKFSRAVTHLHPTWNSAQVRTEAERLSGMWKPGRDHTTALSKRFRSVHGVLSMSAVRDDILMWSHYADHHRGVCLEFKVDKADVFLGARMMEVVYSDDYPVLRYFLDEELENVTTVALRKTKHWEYEQEWRVVDPLHGNGPQVFPPELLTGVILGAEIGPDAERLVRSWASGFGSPLTIYRASLKERSYALDIVPA